MTTTRIVPSGARVAHARSPEDTARENEVLSRRDPGGAAWANMSRP